MYLVDEGVVAVGNSVSLQCGSSGSHIRPHSAGFGHFEVRFRLPVTVLAAVPELRQHGSDGAELLSETVTESSHDGDDERAGQPDGPVKPVFSILKGGQKFLLANFFKTLCFVIRVINSTRENFNKYIIFSFLPISISRALPFLLSSFSHQAIGFFFLWPIFLQPRT